MLRAKAVPLPKTNYLTYIFILNMRKRTFFFSFLLAAAAGTFMACSDKAEEIIAPPGGAEDLAIEDAVNKINTGIVKPVAAMDNGHSDIEGGAANTIDGKTSTLYHSPYGMSVTPSNPAILTYTFKDVPRIDYVTYYPRQDGGTNGNFGKVEIWVKAGGDNLLKKYGDYDFKESSDPHTVTFSGGLKNPVTIQFKVLSGATYAGAGPFAACSEMQFAYDAQAGASNIFADKLMTKLKPGIGAEQLDTVSDAFVKSLGKLILSGNYSLDYRVGTYKCLLSPTTLSKRWSTPGKYYDHLQGVTGINIPKGKHAVVVDGLPDGQNVPLRVVEWFSQNLKWQNNDSIGAGQVEHTFVLHNGINVIDYAGNKPGLAYVCHYADENPEAVPDVSVHFVNGQVNGYLSPDKTNAEMTEILKNARNRCIDLVGSKVHSVWESNALRLYCKTSDNLPAGYRQYMNLLDSLVAWEHKLIGFEKYGHVPENKTMAYVNYTYYMFQSSYGVSFIHSQQQRVLNCKTLMYDDADAIWGLSHEWGHQHQMMPYFCWAGQSECTNNMNSCYNVLRMGYDDSTGRIAQAWKDFKDRIWYGTSGLNISSGRIQAAEAASAAFSWCPELEQLAQSMKGGYVPDMGANPDLGRSIYEGGTEGQESNQYLGVEPELVPYFMLHCYFSNRESNPVVHLPDFTPDLYERMRNTDQSDDKYAILAGAQNGVAGKYAAFKQKYPSSAWITKGYILASSTTWQNSVPYEFNYIRQASLLCGYNLYPFFEKAGFMRLIALQLNDYGTKYIAKTAAMRDEFKADMEALVTAGKLKAMPDGMMSGILNAKRVVSPRPVIPN